MNEVHIVYALSGLASVGFGSIAPVSSSEAQAFIFGLNGFCDRDGLPRLNIDYDPSSTILTIGGRC